MSKLSVVALCAAAVLQSHATLASTWCIDTGSAYAWNLPGATAEASSTKLTLNLGDGRLVKCSSHDGLFDCATAPKEVCSTPTCGFLVGIADDLAERKTPILVSDVDWDSVDATDFLVIRPDLNVDYILFTLCPATSTDAIM